MGLEIRAIEPAEWPAFYAADAIAFGSSPDERERDAIGSHFEFDRSLAAFEGERVVGTSGTYSLELTLPGLAVVPAAGLTAVSVLPTHRRRGILTALVQRHLDDAEQRGEALGLLIAAESVIYGRFGYGPATQVADYQIDPRHSAFSSRVRLPSGRVRLVEGDEARAVVPQVYERYRRAQPGEIGRAGWLWDLIVRDPAWGHHERKGRRMHALYEPEPGCADGWVSWRFEQHWSGSLPDSTVTVTSLYALTPEATVALWRFVLDLDLVGSFRLPLRAVDEPLRWLLADPRRLRTTEVSDALWLRLLDLPRALAARRYATEDALVLEVADVMRPRNQGRFLLEGGPQEASCQPSRAEPDLALDVADLGAAYLGGARLATLARAGRVLELRPGALARADAMLASDPAPLCTTEF